MTSGEVVENTNRKCVDCEGYIDGKCGEDLQYPGGISCQNPQSTQCFKQIEYHEDGPTCKCPHFRIAQMHRETQSV